MRAGRTAAALAGIALVSLMIAGCAPSAIDVPPGFTDSEVNSVMSRWATEQSNAYAGHILGPVEHIRFIEFAPTKEWARTHLNCERRLDGVPTQTALYDNASNYAQAVCGIQYPAPQLRSLLRTPDQLGFLWDYYTSDLIPCLTGFGFEVDGMPSRSEFRRSGLGGLDAWNPYAHLGSRYGTTSGQSRAVRAKCPAVPGGLPAPRPVPDFLP